MPTVFSPSGVLLKCEAKHDDLKLALSSILTIGMVLTYLPQIWKLVRIRSSFGLSVYYLAMRTIAGLCTLCNAIMTQSETIRCCPYVANGICMESLTGLLFICLQFLLGLAIFLMYYGYYPKDKKSTPPDDATPIKRAPEWIASLWINGAVWLILLGSATITGFMFYYIDEAEIGVRVWASITGFSAMLLSVIKLLPQIMKTWEIKGCGALSIPALATQAPGSFLTVIMLMGGKGTTDWLLWASYLISGILETLLLLLCLAFRFVYPKLQAKSKARVQPECSALPKPPTAPESIAIPPPPLPPRSP